MAEWRVSMSKMAKNTSNPIRMIVDGMKLEPNPDLPLIPLSIGDPTVFGNLITTVVAIEGIKQSVESGKYHCYLPSVGNLEARAAVASYVSTELFQLKAEDVILTSGASGALDLCISVLADAGENILIPRPGFSIYRTLAESLGIECRSYNLLPENNWEVDLEHAQSLIDSKTKFMIINNPSNPCGSVFSKEHMLEIINFLLSNRLLLLADEIYHKFVFSNKVSYLFADLTEALPILSCSSLAKRFLVPGWRLGWIVVYDKSEALNDIRSGLFNLSTRILGPNSITQGALPHILQKTPQSFFDSVLTVIECNAKYAYKHLKGIPGLSPIMPQGAMYMMVGIDMDMFPHFNDDLQFTEAMITQVSVFCLPAKCFEYPNYFRIVLTAPAEKLTEACDRIRVFCANNCRST